MCVSQGESAPVSVGKSWWARAEVGALGVGAADGPVGALREQMLPYAAIDLGVSA